VTSRIWLAAAMGLVLNGCVSIATHEEQMRRCRMVGERATSAEARAAELEEQLAAKTKEGEDLQRSIAEMKATQDELSEKLKGDISSGEVAVEASEGNLTITLGDKVLFRSGEWELQPRGQKVLAEVAKVLKKTTDKQVQVEGHTDNIPISGSLKQRFPSNWDLSSARAAAVVRYLEKNGVDPKVLALAAYGDHRPVGDNRTVDGRRQNRRVEITLRPVTEGEKK
jgi:chemotaxis protein MotB